MFKLEEILAKEAGSLSVEEKAFLKENVSKLNDEQKSKFAEELKEEEKEEGVDVESVKALVSKSMQEALADKVDKISDEIVSKFMSGAEKARQKAIDTGKPAEDKNRNVTREFMKALVNGDKVRCKALTTTSDTEAASPDDAAAGLTIPTELRNEVLRVMENYGLARRDMMYLPFSGPGNSRTIPALGTSVSVFWTDEGGKKKSTQPKFSVVTQTLKKLAAIVPFTEEILEDSAINLTALVGQLFAEAVAKEEDIQFFAGTGSPWTGLLNNGSVNQVTEGAGEADDNLADELLRMQDATPSGAQNGAKYYFHRTWLSRVRKLKDENGQYIYQAPAAGLPGTIWDKPYETSDAFPSTSDVEAGDPFIMYGNLKMAAILGDKQQLRVKLLDQATITDSDDSTVLNLAEQDMVALRVVERVGYVLALPQAVTVLLKSETES
jgi:HK97 family phage major capsid protein